MTVNPARVDAKLRTPRAVAGSKVSSPRCLPPSPSAIAKVTSTGNQATLSYQLSAAYPQKDTRSPENPMTTIPTLKKDNADGHNE